MKKNIREFFSRLNQARIVLKNIFFWTIIVLICIALLGSIVRAVSQIPASFLKKKPSILLINIDKPLFEDSYNADLTDWGYSNALFYFDLLEGIKNSISDKKIKTVVIDLNNFRSASLAQIEEMGKLIRTHREDQQFIACATSFSQGSYLLASYCDKIYLDEEGAVSFSGISMKSLFYKNFFEKIGVDVEAFKAGEYKSGIEPYTSEGFSEASKENLSAYASKIWEFFIGEIANNRTAVLDNSSSLTSGKVESYSVNYDKIVKRYKNETQNSESATIYSKIAKDYFFIDATYKQPSYYENKDLLKALNIEGAFLTLREYNSKLLLSLASSSVALLTLEGAIVDSEPNSNTGNVSSERFCKMAKAAFSDPSVKAVVLRINSPGGSATASETIRATLCELSEEHKKPIVVSMGGACASGGYWIATAAKQIYLNKNSLTGSIGVYGMVPTFARLLNEKLSIAIDGVSEGGLGSFGGVEPMSSAAKALLESNIEITYNRFISLVSESRELEFEKVKSLAGGKVYLGEEFVSIGLADREGTVFDAIEAAAKLANLSSYKIDYRKREKSFSEKFAIMAREELFKTKGKLDFDSIKIISSELKQLVDLNCLATKQDDLLLYNFVFVEF